MDKSLAIYKKELANLFNEMALFAKNHPELAIDPSNVAANPHIALLLQSMSILSTKLHLTLDESSKEFIRDLLEMLYPHYVLPIPSISIIALELDKNHGQSVALRQNALLEMETGDLISTFKPCYDSDILPVYIESARCDKIETDLPDILQNKIENAKTLLTIKLKTYGENVFSAITLNNLRLFINGFNKQDYLIYKILMTDVSCITIQNSSATDNYEVLAKDSVKSVGFSEHDSILPCYRNTDLLPYKLITEFFAFPQKFLFCDINLSSIDFSSYQNDLIINIYLNNDELDGNISKDNFILNALPVINLFSKESKQIAIDEESSEYKIIMDDKKPDYFKIYQIEKVMIGLKGEEKEAHKLLNYTGSEDNSDFWYKTRRRNILSNEQNRDLYISFTHKEQKFLKNLEYFYVHTISYNGDIPFEFYSEKETKFRFTDNTLPVAKVKCIVKPTSVQNIDKNREKKGELLSHLSLHYFNITDKINTQLLVKEIINLYSFDNNFINKLIIDSIKNLRIQQEITRIRVNDIYQFCRGNVIYLDFDDARLTKGTIYLFLNILDYFLAMYCSVNSFTKLCAKTTDGKFLYQGLPRNGMKYLV